MLGLAMYCYHCVLEDSHGDDTAAILRIYTLFVIVHFFEWTGGLEDMRVRSARGLKSAVACSEFFAETGSVAPFPQSLSRSQRPAVLGKAALRSQIPIHPHSLSTFLFRFPFIPSRCAGKLSIPFDTPS